MHWYYNPDDKIEDMFFESDVPDGWIKGRIKQKTNGKKYYNNGKIDILLNSNDIIPDGFVLGRKTKIEYTNERNQKISIKLKGRTKTKDHKKKLSDAIKGRYWFNNGIKEAQLQECPPGWVKGRILKELKK